LQKTKAEKGGREKMDKQKKKIRVVNVMKDGRELESLKGIEAPDIIYDILLKDYRVKGIDVYPLEEAVN